MRKKLYLGLSQRETFWKLKNIISKISFFINRIIFQFRYKFWDEKINTRSFWSLVRITFLQLVFSLIFCVCIFIIEYYTDLVASYFKTLTPNEEDYVTLFGSIAGIGGLFIGLYYAAISTLSSSIYSRVPNNIRDLLARERIGNVYMRYLSFLTLVSLIFIALRVLGFQILTFAVILIIPMAGIGIIAFVKLGQRAFYLFDPSKLSYSIFIDLHRYLKLVSINGYKWNDPSFQQHFRKQFLKSIDTFNDLCNITSQEEHLRNEPYFDLIKSSIALLAKYHISKRKIPTQSNWYEDKYKHHEWYSTPDHSLTIAHQTATQVQPEIVKNDKWVEQKIIPIWHNFLRMLLKNKNFEGIKSYLNAFVYYIDRLVIEGYIEESFDLIEEHADIIFSPDHFKHIDENNLQLEYLSLIEFLSYLPIRTLLTYVNIHLKYNKDFLHKIASNINWNNQSSIYKQDIPSYLLKRFEWFYERLNFEYQIENKIITPNWYKDEIISQLALEQIGKNINQFINRAFLLYSNWITLNAKQKNVWFSATILSREREFLNKIHYHLNSIMTFSDGFNEDRRIDGLPWHEINFDDIKKVLQLKSHDLLEDISKYIVQLITSEKPDDFPDYGGQFLHTTAETILDSLIEADINLLHSTFKHFFYGSVVQSDNLKPNVIRSESQLINQLKISIAPLLDLMDISGYAYLLSEYHNNNDVWSKVVKIWDDYLKANDVHKVLNYLVKIIEITESSFEIPHRGILRTSWLQKIERLFSELPRKEIIIRGSISSDKITIHQSPLVRIFSNEHFYNSFDGIDIFVNFYLAPKFKSHGIKLKRRKSDIEERLEFENQEYKEHMNSNNSHKDV